MLNKVTAFKVSAELGRLSGFFKRPIRNLLAAVLTVAALGVPAGPARADAVGPAGEGAAAPAVRTARGWAAMSGSDLKGTLDGWSRAAGWTLVWDSQVNYRLRASAQFAGDFETAVASLVDTIHRSNPEVLVTLYRGNRVVHVETTLVETR
jgi:type IV pili sensor histidine kinase/response regulator